jgi:hypothetical protein
MPPEKIHSSPPAGILRSNSYAGLIMRRALRHRHEIMELLENANER